MQLSPMVSVCMAAYNASRFIGSSLASLSAQTFSNYELIVVDDGSTDDTWQIITRHARGDARLKPLRNETNRGLVYTRNRCLQQCSASLVAVADADDIHYPGRLEEEVRFMERHPDVGVVGAAVHYIDEYDRRQGTSKDLLLTDNEIRFFLKLGPCIHNTTTMYRREALIGSGGYRQGFDVGAEDYDLWARLSRATRFANLPTPLVAYRRHSSSTTGRGDNHVARIFFVASESLTDYLERPISERDARELILLLWGGLDVDTDCQAAVALAMNLEGVARKAEEPHTVRRFNRRLAKALWGEARNRIYAQRRLSLALACRAIRRLPPLLVHPSFPGYAIRCLTPAFARGPIKAALMRLRRT